MDKKITLATLKAFVRKNRANLLIDTISDFDGMVDGVRECANRSFIPVVDAEVNHPNNLGIQGVWCVLRGNDYFSAFERDGVRGIHVYNSCGSFDIGVKV